MSTRAQPPNGLPRRIPRTGRGGGPPGRPSMTTTSTTGSGAGISGEPESSSARIMQGPTLFARYAYPPNERGSCGPPQSRTVFEYGVAAVVDPGLEQLARQFSGAWPYLEFIAGV